MILSPEQYSSSSVYELLEAAASGQVGLDHRYLHAILDRGAAAVPDIVRFGSEERAEGQEAFDLEILLLVRALRNPEAAPLLKEYARRADFELSEELMSAFVALGAASVEPLLELAQEAEDAYDIRSTLANLGVRDGRILDLLVKELEQDPAGGAMSLSLYGDPAAVPALEAAIGKAPDEWTRGEIRKTIEALKSGTPQGETEAFDIWEEYPEESDPEFQDLSDEELTEFLDSPEPEYRRGAVSALGSGDLTPKLRARILGMARKDPDAAVRGACWAAMDGFLDDKDIQAALMAKLTDRNAPLEERIGPALALAPLSQDPVVAASMEEFYEHPELRAQALTAMWRSRNPDFERFFPPHLDDEDEDVKVQAIMGVGWLGIRSQLSRLEKFFRDEDYRDVALHAYAMAAPAELTKVSLSRVALRLEQIAGTFSEEESETVYHALDMRLMLNGMDPMFSEHSHEHGPDCGCGEEEHEHAGQAVSTKVGRNEPCPCGSGKKYKKCCGQ